MNEALVFDADGGLANRLRALVGMYVLAELRGVPLAVYWRANGACDATFDELFLRDAFPGLLMVDALTADYARRHSPSLYFYTASWFSSLWEQHARNLTTRAEFCKHAVAKLRALRPHPAHQKSIDALVDSERLQDAVGIHIRLTDNVHVYDWWQREDSGFVRANVSTLDGFEALVGTLAESGERIFLATDNPMVTTRLRRWSDQIVTHRKRYAMRGLRLHLRSSDPPRDVIRGLRERLRLWPRVSPPASWRTTSLADATIDLYALSHCKRIVGSYYSSFNQVSSLLRGAPLETMRGAVAHRDEFTHEMNELGRAARA